MKMKKRMKTFEQREQERELFLSDKYSTKREKLKTKYDRSQARKEKNRNRYGDSN